MQNTLRQEPVPFQKPRQDICFGPLVIGVSLNYTTSNQLSLKFSSRQITCAEIGAVKQRISSKHQNKPN